MLKNTFSFIRNKYAGLSLYHKFRLITLFLAVSSLVGSIIGSVYLYNHSNEMFYQSIDSSLRYSASTLSGTLKNVEKLSYQMLTDSKLQDDLSVSKDQTSTYAQRSEAFSELVPIISEFYRNNRQYSLSFIDLYTDTYVIHSDITKSARISAEILDEVRELAHEQPGYAVWFTEHCQDHGLLLGRDIRRAARLQLDTIGTLVIGVDMNSLVTSSMANAWKEGESSCVLCKDGTLLYYSPLLTAEKAEKLIGTANKSYGILRNGADYLFYARGVIPIYDWEYIFLLPYSSVVRAENGYLATTICMFIIVVVLSSLAAARMISSITAHFDRLVNKMKQFGADNNTLPVSDYNYSRRNDEIGKLHQNFDRMASQIHTLIQNEYKNELLTKEAELNALESQINPHFLYNTLECINWHAKAVDADEISRMVEALGDMMRMMLDRKNKIATIESELTIVSKYMSIIKIRFGDRVEYTENVPDELKSIIIPKLSLQPIVENAVNYALESSLSTCVVSIDGCRKGDNIELRISNTGSQFPDDLLNQLRTKAISPHGFGIGLLNIDKRLKLLLGDDYGLFFENDVLADTATVIMKLPASAEEQKGGLDQ